MSLKPMRSEEKEAARQRFMRIMTRHIRSDDITLKDDELVKEAFKRYLNDRKQPIIDVNE